MYIFSLLKRLFLKKKKTDAIKQEKEFQLNENYFEWNDAWVFVSLFIYDETFRPVELSEIIASGDMVNHAILMPNELRQGFSKLTLQELIEVKENKIRLTQKGVIIKDKIKKEKGGLFSMIDNTLKKLNSSRFKLNTHKIYSEIKYTFLKDELVEKGYKKYSDYYKKNISTI